MTTIRPNFIKPAFTSNTERKISFRESDRDLTPDEKSLIDEGWPSGGTLVDPSTKKKWSTTKKVLLTTGGVLLAAAIALRIVKPADATEGFGTIKRAINTASTFVHKYTGGIGSAEAAPWSSLWTAVKSKIPGLKPTASPTT